MYSHNKKLIEIGKIINYDLRAISKEFKRNRKTDIETILLLNLFVIQELGNKKTPLKTEFSLKIYKLEIFVLIYIHIMILRS